MNKLFHFHLSLLPLLPSSSRDARTAVRYYDNRILPLVFSDEFNVEDRGFDKGEDPYFEALTMPDDTNHAIQFYNGTKEYATTRNGSLVLITRAVHTSWQEYDLPSESYLTVTMNYTSAMVQSWNKLCFTGGIIEFAVQLPSDGNSSGLWPALWLMGNLGRAVYQNSSQFIWPWSTTECLGEVNSSGQLFSACIDSIGFGFHPNQGRGAPEIDIFESMANQWKQNGQPGYMQAYISSSFQLSPGTDFGLPQRPLCGQSIVQDGNDTVGAPYGWGCNNGTCPSCLGDDQTACEWPTCIEWDYNWGCNLSWYSDLEVGSNGWFNGYFGQEVSPTIYGGHTWGPSYVADGISWNTNTNLTVYESPHIYRLEWQPGQYIDWYLDGEFLFGIPQESLTKKGNGAIIPVEPMYIIANVAMMSGWGIASYCDANSDCADICLSGCLDCQNPECQCALTDGMKDCKMFPTEMKIDYVRLYQDTSLESVHTIGCDPPDFPTAVYIASHMDSYRDWAPAECSPNCPEPLPCIQIANGLCLKYKPVVLYIFLTVFIFLGVLLVSWAYYIGLVSSNHNNGYVELPNKL